MRLFATLWKVGKFFSNVIFLVLTTKGQLMMSTLPERKFFLDTPGDQGAIRRRPVSKHRENTFMSIKIDGVIRFWSTFFLKLGVDNLKCHLKSWTEAEN